LENPLFYFTQKRPNVRTYGYLKKEHLLYDECIKNQVLAARTGNNCNQPLSPSTVPVSCGAIYNNKSGRFTNRSYQALQNNKGKNYGT